MTVPQRFALLVLLCALIAGAGASPASAAKTPRGMFGLGDWGFPAGPDLKTLSRKGVRNWRTTLAWGVIEQRPGVYDFSGYDQLLRAAAKRRVRILLTIAGCPDWACATHGPPRTAEANAAFQRFVDIAVRRYGHGGELWRGKRRPLVVSHWQLMNEVNGADQWPNPDPAAYAALLKRTAATIRAADPRARVVLAGLPEKMTIWLRSYLPALYRQPGFAQDFDVMAVHGYAVRWRGPGKILELTRRIMRRNRDRKPVWITEMGWATGGPRFPFRVSPRKQARNLRKSFTQLVSCRKRWNLRRVYWFAHRDRDPRGERDYWGFHNGLRYRSGRAKPAYRAFTKFLRVKGRRTARVPGRCRR